MSSLSTFAILFGLFVATSFVASQVINDDLSLFLEYVNPGWRRHRARFIPFIYSDPVPVYRVSKRSIKGEDSKLLINYLFYLNTFVYKINSSFS
jgi:hypothetical protein